MDLKDDLVVDDPLTFCDYLEGEFSANVFGFGNNYCFWFHQVWSAESHKVSILPYLFDFGFSKFGLLGHVGDQSYRDWMILVSPTLVVT